MTIKEKTLQVIRGLPDDVDYREIAEMVAFLAAISGAEKDIAEGRLVTNEAMKARIAGWMRGT